MCTKIKFKFAHNLTKSLVSTLLKSSQFLFQLSGGNFGNFKQINGHEVLKCLKEKNMKH